MGFQSSGGATGQLRWVHSSATPRALAILEIVNLIVSLGCGLDAEFYMGE